MGKLYEELKRRKVFRVAGVYAVVAWFLIQVTDVVLPTFEAPTWVNQTIIFLFVLGFPVAVILAWAYESTPDGIKPDSAIPATAQVPATQNQALIYAMFVLLLVAVGFQVADRFLLADNPSTALSRLSEISSAAPNPPTQLSVALPDDIAYQALNGAALGLTLSPDGQQLVFTGNVAENGTQERRLVHRGLNQRSLTPITGTENTHNPFFSPDSQSVGYFTTDGQLKRATLDGRPPVTITEAASQFSRGLWVDATIYFTGPPSSTLWKVSVEGGPAEQIPFDRQEISPFIRNLAYVPDTGELLVYWANGPEERGILLLNKDTGETHPILDDVSLVGYVGGSDSGTGYVLFLRDQNLMTARFDAVGRRLGFAVPVLEGFAWDSTRVVAQIALSQSGTLGYVVESDTTIPTTLNEVQVDGTRTFLAELAEGSASVKLSPDGNYAAIATRQIPYTVYLWDMTLQVPTGLEIESASSPSWRPDGKQLIFENGRDVIALNMEDGSREVLLSVPGGIETPSLSADGATLVFVTSNGDDTRGIYAQLPGESTPEAVIVTGQNTFNPVLSPDGQWLAYDSGIRFDNSVYVARFPSGTERRRVSQGSARFPTWRSDGKALFFSSVAGPGEPVEMQIVVAESTQLESFSAPRTLFTLVDSLFSSPETLGAYTSRGASWSISDDGDQFLIVYRPRDQGGDEIVIAQNWLTELERLLPSDVF